MEWWLDTLVIGYLFTVQSINEPALEFVHDSGASEYVLDGRLIAAGRAYGTLDTLGRVRK